MWAVNGEFTNQNKERWTPVTHKYQPTFQPWIEVVEFQDLLPITIDATMKSSKGKPTGYAIPPAIWQSDIYQTVPPTWAKHLATLEKKKNNPLPKKGVAGRIRSKNVPAPSALPTPNTTRISGSGARGRRRRGRSTPAPDISMLLGTPSRPALKAAGDRELSLIASIQAVHGRARIAGCAHGRLA